MERIEAAVIRHYTSRAGDPHRHLHLQINARVFAAGGWRGLHSVGMRDSLEAINGIGHAAVATDPAFRKVLVEKGLTLDPVTGEIAELAPYAARFSARAAQIGRNLDRYEAEWRASHPGEQPGPRLRRAWDRRAWSQARPDKVVPKDGAAMVAAWNEELRRLGYRDPIRTSRVASPSVGSLDREAAVELAISRLGAKRSAWNAADIRGQVEQWIAEAGLAVTAAVRIELAEDLAARAVAACAPLLTRDDVPEHVRGLTSPRVIGVEDRIAQLLGLGASIGGRDAKLRPITVASLDPTQRGAVAALAGTKCLMVIEGAAGGGKTTTLAATKEILAKCGKQMMVVTPTLKAAEVAAAEIEAPAFSAAWLIHQWGWRWDDDGHWTTTRTIPADPRAVLGRGDLLVVDEAGMLDQDTARALLEIASGCGARIAFMGDRHQLPAVGRGGVLDLAAQHAGPESTITLDVVHRFADPEYAQISLAMRRGTDVDNPTNDSRESVFEALWRRGQIKVHAGEPERLQALAGEAADAIIAGHHRSAVMADNHDQVTALNAMVRDRLVADGVVDDSRVVINEAGERLGIGDRVATRRNDWKLGVANRQTWTITGAGDREVSVRNDHGQTRQVPIQYARKWIELAYATTVYGAQGETTRSGHMLIGDTTTAAAAYVGMTRGRHNNSAHIVAEIPEQAEAIWSQVFARDRADLGVAHARLQAIDDIDRYGPVAPGTDRTESAEQRRSVPRGEARRRPEPVEPLPQRATGAPAIGL